MTTHLRALLAALLLFAALQAWAAEITGRVVGLSVTAGEWCACRGLSGGAGGG